MPALTMDSPLSLGQRIRALRRRRGLTQQQLADAVGCTSTHLRGVEHDRNGVSIALLDKLGEELGAELVVNLQPADSSPVEELSTDERELLMSYRAIAPEQRVTVRSLLRLLPRRPPSVAATLGALVALWERDDLADVDRRRA